MKFQDDISNMNTHKHTHIRTSRNQYVPHFFKVGGMKSGSVFIGLMTSDGTMWFRYQRAVLMR